MAFMSIYGFIKIETELHMHKNISNLTWNRYVNEVGIDQFSKNPRMVYRKFEMYHFGKQVSWEGYVIRVNLNEDDPLSLRYHSVQIMVKMEPEDHKEEHGPDLGISFSEMSLERNSE
jgi:hypothetical protein